MRSARASPSPVGWAGGWAGDAGYEGVLLLNRGVSGGTARAEADPRRGSCSGGESVGPASTAWARDEEIVTVEPCQERILELERDARVRECQKKLSAQHLRIVEQDALVAALRGKVEALRAEVEAERGERQRVERCSTKIKQMVEGKAAWWDGHKRELADTISALQDENERLRCDHSRTATDLTLKITDLHAAAQAKVAEQHRHAATIERLEEEAAELKQSVLDRTTANKALIVSLNAADAKARRQIEAASRTHAAAANDLRQEVQRQAALLAQLRESNTAITADRQALHDRIDALDAAHAAALAENAQELDALRAAATERDAAAAELKGAAAAEARRLELVVKEKESVISGLEAAHGALEGDWRAACGERDAAEAALAAARAEVDAERRKVAKSEQDHLLLRANLSRENDRLRAAVEELEAAAALREAGFAELLAKKEAAIIALEDDAHVLRELLPEHALSDAAAEGVYAREATLRATLSQALSDTVHLGTLLQGTGRPMLCNPECEADQTARTHRLSVPQIARRVQDAVEGLVASARDALAARGAGGAKATEDLTLAHDDCAVQ